MHRQLVALVEQPSKATFLAARDAVLCQSPLPLAAAQIAELDRLLDQGDFEALRDRLETLPASKVLSPRVHFLAAEVADALGNSDDMELERCLFVITLKGLLATGDGTRANPYIVCHASDEHDVLDALGREASQQSIVDNAGRLCDVIRCTDGREVWFDVTHAITKPKVTPQKRRLARSRSPRRPVRLAR